jgi:hypothetical protein
MLDSSSTACSVCLRGGDSITNVLMILKYYLANVIFINKKMCSFKVVLVKLHLILILYEKADFS